MRILIVSYWYGPLQHPRPLRWSAVAESLVSRGHQVDVLCSWFPGLPREEERGGVGVMRIGGYLSGRLRSAPGMTGRGEEATGVLRRAVIGLWRGLRWPDYACLWLRPAAAGALRLAAGRTYDGLVSVSDPFTSHRAALHLARRQPGLPWLVDIGDPFSPQVVTPVNNLRLYRRRNRRAEEEVLSRAGALTFTAETAREQYARAFPSCAGRMHVVPPLCAPVADEGAGERVFPVDGAVRMVFVGTLYRAVRNPRPLLELFRALREKEAGVKAELHFFGNVNDTGDIFAVAGDLASQGIFLHGVVPRARVWQAMREADCLVNIGNATAAQLPSKVAEYVSTGRPIIHLEAGPRDSSSAFLQGYPGLFTVPPGGEGGMAGSLAAFLRQPPPMPEGELDRWRERFGTEAVVDRYEKLLAVLASGNPEAGSALPADE